MASLLAAMPLAALEPGAQPADAWLSAGQHPVFVPSNVVSRATFESLQAEVLAGRLKVRWHPETEVPEGGVMLYTSADPPGRWQVRDWRPRPMQRRQGFWEAPVPVDHVGVPVVYFVAVGRFEVDQPMEAQPRPREVSPLRVAYPLRLGLRAPSRVFWPFLEGFEEDLAAWRLLSDASQGFDMSRSPLARNGRMALMLSVPRGKAGVSAGTTRIRGWQIAQQNASGFSLWLRTDRGKARARFALFGQKEGQEHVTAPCRHEVEVTDRWKRFDIAFADFRGFHPGHVDLLTMELVGEGPRRFWIDDLQLRGPWTLE